jgi:hypothetical protein
MPVTASSLEVQTYLHVDRIWNQRTGQRLYQHHAGLHSSFGSLDDVSAFVASHPEEHDANALAHQYLDESLSAALTP